jgi:hypothetical protein
MHPKHLELLYDGHAFRHIIALEEMTWMDFKSQIARVFEELGGPCGYDLAFLRYHTLLPRKGIVLDETDWRVFKEHIDFCPYCADPTPLPVVCIMMAKRLRIELVSLTGPLGSIEVRRNADLDELLSVISNSKLIKRRRVQVLNGLTPLKNSADWQDFLRNIPPAPQVPRLTCVFLETSTDDPEDPQLQEIKHLERELRREPPNVDAILNLSYVSEDLLRDEILYDLFVNVLKNMLANMTPTEAKTLYTKLERLWYGPKIQEALADLAFVRSEGKTFHVSPMSWQESRPVEEIWNLLNTDIVPYDHLSLGIRLKLNNIDKLDKYVRTHPEMAKWVPRSLRKGLKRDREVEEGEKPAKRSRLNSLSGLWTLPSGSP